MGVERGGRPWLTLRPKTSVRNVTDLHAPFGPTARNSTSNNAENLGKGDRNSTDSECRKVGDLTLGQSLRKQEEKAGWWSEIHRSSKPSPASASAEGSPTKKPIA